MNFVFWVRIFLAVSLFFGMHFPNKVYAADIEIVISPYCQIRLTGQISAGDTQNLRIASEILRYEGVWGGDPRSQIFNLRLCLDSPGGSLIEAASLAEYTFEIGIGTVLEPGSECLSACAWVFMMGYARGEEGYVYTSRHMHYTSRLGFHAPRLELGQREVLSRDEAEQAQAVLNSAVSIILELSNSWRPGSGPAIDADLLQEAFSTGNGSANFFIIDTVDQAGRWRIPVFGFQWPEEIDVESAIWACTNLTRWPVARTGSDRLVVAETGMSEVLPRVEPVEARLLRVPGLGSIARLNECIVSLQISEGRIRACGYNETTRMELRSGDSRSCNTREDSEENYLQDYDALAIFPFDTQIANLPAASLDIATSAGSQLSRTQALSVVGQFAPERATLMNLWISEAIATERPVFADEILHRSCISPSDMLRVVRVNEFATLRERPSFDAPILSRIPRGTYANVLGSPNLAGPPERVNACRTACLNAGTAGNRSWPGVRRCYLDNILWFPVDHDGQRGFVASRYLGE